MDIIVIELFMFVSSVSESDDLAWLKSHTGDVTDEQSDRYTM